MADRSPIEWTEATWNPIVGCSVLTPGCTNCYAMRMAARIEKMAKGDTHYAGTTKLGNGKPVWTGKLVLSPKAILEAPLRWKAPRMIFADSMGDLFHDDIPDAWIDQVFAIMALTPHHTYQVLTKRSARMRAYLKDRSAPRRIYDLVCDMVIAQELQVVLIANPSLEAFAPAGQRVYLGQWPLVNVWLGVSAERQQEANERIPDLLETPAAIRFVSAEPLLGPLDFTELRTYPREGTVRVHRPLLGYWGDAVDHGIGSMRSLPKEQRNTGTTATLNWIIVGGESGPGARPMHPDWVRAIRDQCDVARVPFFFKQWGAFRPLNMIELRQACGATMIGNDPYNRDSYVLRTGKKAAGRLLDGREHNAMPRRQL